MKSKLATCDLNLILVLDLTVNNSCTLFTSKLFVFVILPKCFNTIMYFIMYIKLIKNI